MALPVANAGADRTILADSYPKARVKLDGSLSTDPDFVIKAQGTLTLAVNPTAGDSMTVGAKTYTFRDYVGAAVAAQGTLTLDTNPTNGDTMYVGSKSYTFQSTLTNVDGNVKIGATLGDTKASLVAAFDLSGTGGVDYAATTTAHPTVDISAFAGNVATLTAKTAGAAGNSIATTETFTAGTNVFNGATLGTTTLGRNLGLDGEIKIGAGVANTKTSLVAAFDLSGVAGTDYATAMTAHPTVDIAAFVGDDAVLTAKTGGPGGNSIVTTETFTSGLNVFDGPTLGTATLGSITGTLDDYAWSSDTGVTATGATPTVELAPGVHTFTLTVTEGGQTDDDTVVINVTGYALDALQYADRGGENQMQARAQRLLVEASNAEQANHDAMI
jgi:hypothetical protein